MAQEFHEHAVKHAQPLQQIFDRQTAKTTASSQATENEASPTDLVDLKHREYREALTRLEKCARSKKIHLSGQDLTRHLAVIQFMCLNISR